MQNAKTSQQTDILYKIEGLWKILQRKHQDLHSKLRISIGFNTCWYYNCILEQKESFQKITRSSVDYKCLLDSKAGF